MNSPETQSRHSVQRMVRPDPRTFTHFPPDSKCPICGTNDDGKAVLVEISGTAKDGIAEAKPMHLACAVAKQWDEGMGIALTWPNTDYATARGSTKPTSGSNSDEGACAVSTAQLP